MNYIFPDVCLGPGTVRRDGPGVPYAMGTVLQCSAFFSVRCAAVRPFPEALLPTLPRGAFRVRFPVPASDCPSGVRFPTRLREAFRVRFPTRFREAFRVRFPTRFRVSCGVRFPGPVPGALRGFCGLGTAAFPVCRAGLRSGSGSLFRALFRRLLTFS